MDSAERAVKVVAKKSREHIYYVITLPKEFADELGIGSGDILHVRIVKINLDSKEVRGLFYYKPKP